MADVNEEIIEQYLKLIKKWFYISDISFKVPRNYSNIDLLAYNPFNNKYYDIEVKYRSVFSVTAKSRQGVDKSTENTKWLTDQFSNFSSREAKIKEYIGKQKAIKVLVTTKQLFGKSTKKREHIETSFKESMTKLGFRKSEVWYFDDIIPELYKSVPLKGKFNTELIQAIRMIKTYNK